MREDTKPLHECKCRICGKAFYAKNKRQVICSEECKKVAQAEWYRRYIEKNAGRIRERQQLMKERKKREASMKPDTIVGKGYAERQMAKTLEMAGKINTEL